MTDKMRIARSFVRERVLVSLPRLEEAIIRARLVESAAELEAAIVLGLAEAAAAYKYTGSFEKGGSNEK